MQRRVLFRLSLVTLLALLAIGLSVMLRAVGTINLATFNGPFLNPVGIDYYEPLDKLLMSANYPNGIPYNLNTVDNAGVPLQFSPLAGQDDELKVTTVKSGPCMGGFMPGDTFVGNGNPGEIALIRNGLVFANPWITLGTAAHIRGSMFQDRFCSFGGDLIVATGNSQPGASPMDPYMGEVWRVSCGNPTGNPLTACSAPVATMVVDLHKHLEGVVTVPNDPATYGPMAGRILVGDEDRSSGPHGQYGKIFAIRDANDIFMIAKDVDPFYSYPTILATNPIHPEDLDWIPRPVDQTHPGTGDGRFFGIDYGNGRILTAGITDFGQFCGDLLITREYPSIGYFNSSVSGSASGLSTMRWNPGTGKFDINLLNAALNAPAQWEHVTFRGGADCRQCTGTIGDFVWKDIDGDGIQDAVEPGIPGVAVTLTMPGVPGWHLDTVTDATGHYEFIGLCAGTYHVTVTPPAGDTFTLVDQGVDDTKDSDGGAAGVDVVLVGDSDTNTKTDFGLKGPGVIGDFVWNDGPLGMCNGIQDGTEPASGGLAGIMVHLKLGLNNPGGVDVATTVTDGSGHYQFQNLNPGGYTVVVDTPAGYVPAPNDVGGDDTVDSDGVGGSASVTLPPNVNTSIDFGFCSEQPPQPGLLLEKIPDPTVYSQVGQIITYTYKITNTGNVVLPGPFSVTDSEEGTTPAIVALTPPLYTGAATFNLVGPTVLGLNDTIVGKSFPSIRPLQSTVAYAGADNDFGGNTGRRWTEHILNNSGVAWSRYRVVVSGGTFYSDAFSPFQATIVNPAGPNPTITQVSPANGTTVTLSGGNTIVDFAFGVPIAPGSYLDIHIPIQGLNPAGGAFTLTQTPSFTINPCGSGPLNPGDFTTCQFQRTITQDDLNICSPIVDTATASTYYNQQLLQSQDTATVYGQCAPAAIGDFVWLDLDRDGQQDGGEPGIAGVTVELRACVGDALAGTDVTDGAGIYGFTVAPGDYYVKVLAPAGAYDKFTTQNAGADATDSDVNAAGQTGCVTLASGDNNLTVDAGLLPIDLQVTKTVNNPTPAVGTNVVFTVTVTNNNAAPGVSTATGVVVTDLLPAGLAYVSDVASQGGYVSGTGVWTVGTLVPGGSATLAITATVTTGGLKTNGAQVTAANQTDVDSQPAEDAFPPPNQDDEAVASVTPPAAIGDFVWLDLDRDGQQDGGEPGIAGVTVELRLCSDNSPVGAPDVTDGAGIYGFTVAPGDYYVKVLAPAGAYDKFTTQDAGADATDSDVNAAGQTGCVTLASGDNNLTVDAGLLPIDLQLVKTVNNPTPAVGTNVVFTVTVTNNNAAPGVSTATGVVVTDLLPAGLAYVSHLASQGGYVSGTGVWTVGTLVPGGSATLTITATVTSLGTKTNGAQVTAANQTDVDSQPGENGFPPPDQDDEAVASVTPPELASIGDLVWVDLDRDGQQDGGEPGIAGVTVELRLCSDNSVVGAPDVTDGSGIYGFTVAAGQYYVKVIAPAGAYDKFTAQDAGADATDSDVNAAGQTGCVTLAAGDNNLTVDAGLLPIDLQLVKTVNNPTPAVGSNVIFTLTLTNNNAAPGVSTATGVVVDDVLPAGLTYVSSTPSAPTTYSNVTGDWTVGTLAPGASATLAIEATVTTPGTKTNYTQVVAANQTDVDSTPNNNAGPVPVEDDEAAVSLTPPGMITIIKDTAPNQGQDFTFNTTGGLSPVSFMLDDDADGTLLNTKVYNSVTPGTYTVTEVTIPFFATIITSCTVDAAGAAPGSSFLPTDETVSITLTSGGAVTCTYTNSGFLLVECPVLPSGTVGVAYGPGLVPAFGGSGSYQFSTFGGTGLPPGLRIDPSAGVPLPDFGPSPGAISGTPTAAGDYLFIIQVIDTIGTPPAQSPTLCPIHIDGPPPQLLVQKTPDGGVFLQGQQASFTIVVSNPAPPGAGTATNVQLTDTLPFAGGLVWASVVAVPVSLCVLSPPPGPQLLNCILPDLAPGQQVTVTVTSTNPTPVAACQPQPNANPGAVATADGGLIDSDEGSLNCIPPPQCSLTVDKQCAVQPPPTAWACSDAKPIDSMTVIWNGSQTVWVKAWNGGIGTGTPTLFPSVDPGESVTFTRSGTFPNDIYFELFIDAGMTTKYGTGKSTFHLSCSDADMTDPLDCGKPAGNGKGLSGYVNEWKFDGMAGKNGLGFSCSAPDPGGLTFTNSCTGAIGSVVTYRYEVTNGSGIPQMTTLSDNALSPNVFFNGLLGPGTSTFFRTTTLTSVPATNTVTASYPLNGGSCSAQDSVTVSPPPSAWVCKDAKPIDTMTVIWNGAGAVYVKAWNGSIGTGTPQTFGPIDPGGDVTFNRVGAGTYPNDIYFELFTNAAMTIKYGTGKSTFHLSCSDADMTDPLDCGKAAGDGKAVSGYVNQWTFDGMSGKGGLGFSCTP